VKKKATAEREAPFRRGKAASHTSKTPGRHDVVVPRAAWEALVRFFREEEQVYRDSYNTPGKENWKRYFREHHPEDYERYKAAAAAAGLIV
jgi:hypothetical protein